MLKSSHVPKKTSFAQTLEPSWVEVMVDMESPLGIVSHMVSHTDIVKLVVVGMARVAAMVAMGPMAMQTILVMDIS